MNRRVVWISLLFSLAAAAVTHAQAPTTVQLPTFSRFGGSTTVLVPDGGSVHMGGISRAASGRNTFGVPMLPFRPFRSSAIGTERSASNLHVTATIHDFKAMDRQILGEDFLSGPQQMMAQPGMQQQAFQPRPTMPSRRPDPRIGSSWQLAMPKPEASVESRVAQIRAESQARRNVAATEAADYFERGREAEESGKFNVAKIYYRMALRKADDPLRSQAALRLAAIAQAETKPQVAQNTP